MPEKEPKFTSQEAERGPQEAEDKIEEKELKKLIEAKTEYVYQKNIVIRFTNAAFLDGVFVTKNEFKGYNLLFLPDGAYTKYRSLFYEFDENGTKMKKISYPNLPDGISTLGGIIRRVYKNWSSVSDVEKIYIWDDFIFSNTGTWAFGSGGKIYTDWVGEIKQIQQKSSDRADFAHKLRDYVIQSYDLLHNESQRAKEVLEDQDYYLDPSRLRDLIHRRSGMVFDKDEEDVKELQANKEISRKYNIGILVSAETIKDCGHMGNDGQCTFKNSDEIDIQKDLKGIICTIRDRVFEKKVIKSMFELTAQNPETRVPVFDLDGNQIWPTRKKREDIEGTIKQKQKAAMEELD